PPAYFTDCGGPKGIWQTDVFSAARCLIRLPFEGLALAALPAVIMRRIRGTAPNDRTSGNGRADCRRRTLDSKDRCRPCRALALEGRDHPLAMTLLMVDPPIQGRRRHPHHSSA